MKITEALAEIQTIEKRLSKKRQFVLDRLFLQGHMRDPLEKEGGTRNKIAEERQSIADLEKRVVEIRVAINEANKNNTLEIAGTTKTIAEWLVWRREVASGHGSFLQSMMNGINNIRRQVQEKGLAITDKAESSNQLEVFVSETELQSAIDKHETMLGELDGRLSLANATIDV